VGEEVFRCRETGKAFEGYKPICDARVMQRLYPVFFAAGPGFIYGRSDPGWHGSCGERSQGYRDFTDADAGRMRACAIDCHASRCALAPSERRGLFFI
jgi:hypothetical protein